MEKIIRCHKCGETKYTLYKVKDSEELKYVCVKCK